jgi:hypothetical protein
MPSPFPGMDPYLEDPAIWRGVHQRFVVYLADAISDQLPSGYAAAVEERVYVEQAGRFIYPDVLLTGRAPGKPATGGRAAVLDVPDSADPGWELVPPAIEVREPYIQLLATTPGRRVVTQVELLSPTNKRSGSDGRQEYLRKQEEALGAHVNLVEIDLIRAGEHTAAVPSSQLRARGTWTYLACLLRPRRGFLGLAWPIHLRDPLPRIAVPLGEGDGEVSVSLQPLLDAAYDRNNLRERLDYSVPPPLPPLSPADSQWVLERLQAAGLRPPGPEQGG